MNNENSTETRRHPPIGNLLLRTLAMPADTNPAGDIFGGWIMSQMDIAGALLAREIANGRVVTVAVEGMSFLKPVTVGDIVCCYGKCIHVGHTSMKVHMEIWVKKFFESATNEHVERYLVTEANYTYVSVDAEGKPRPLPSTAQLVAEKGIDAACVGLNQDGSIRED